MGPDRLFKLDAVHYLQWTVVLRLFFGAGKLKLIRKPRGWADCLGTISETGVANDSELRNASRQQPNKRP